jgi:hypothetical protein
MTAKDHPPERRDRDGNRSRKDRLASKLRENLKRRKAQVRMRGLRDRPDAATDDGAGDNQEKD